MSAIERVCVTIIDSLGAPRSIVSRLGVSLMEMAIEHAVSGIEAQCYGATVCGTCHVHVGEAWLAATGRPGDWEQAMLDELVLARPDSRLACQIMVSAALDGAHFSVPDRQEALQ